MRQGQNSFERIYEHIVLTVPFTVLRHIDLRVDLPPTKRLAIDQLGYGTGTKLIAPFRERIWRTRYHSTAAVFTDLPFQSAWESTRYAPGEKAWLASLTGGDRGLALGSGSPESHAWAMTSELEAIFPGISQVKQGRALRAFWTGEPYQRGSYSCYLVGQWTQFGGVESERVGNLWFAGEHCSPGAKGYMEGGCETGRAVAASILTRREDSYS
ncbi:MAG: FAD-dependent oxidoreductase [Leptolyngbyaceae cyanobacterium RM1_406_9]|nr:FAD-dependent oxidoreductase [Leptolyngbyaceae cyanobacterium RM1_406_9]